MVLSALAKVSNALKKEVVNNERVLSYTLKKFRVVVKLDAIKHFHLEVTYIGTVYAKTQGQTFNYVTMWPLCTVRTLIKGIDLPIYRW